MSRLDIWVIYDHPRDYPNNFIARLWDVDQITETLIKAHTLEHLQETFVTMGLTKIIRDDDDDPCIVESWL